MSRCIPQKIRWCYMTPPIQNVRNDQAGQKLQKTRIPLETYRKESNSESCSHVIDNLDFRSQSAAVRSCGLLLIFLCDRCIRSSSMTALRSYRRWPTTSNENIRLAYSIPCRLQLRADIFCAVCNSLYPNERVSSVIVIIFHSSSAVCRSVKN
ncbi:hypothetical protein ACFE04_026769 [Oxalis oulophora]